MRWRRGANEPVCSRWRRGLLRGAFAWTPTQLFHGSFDMIAVKQSRQTLVHKLDEFVPPVLARLDMNDIDFMAALDGSAPPRLGG